jgi:hypothetical protein
MKRNTITPFSHQSVDCRIGSVAAKLKTNKNASEINVSARALTVQDLIHIETFANESVALRSIQFGENFTLVLSSEDTDVSLKGGVLGMPECRVVAAFIPKCRGLQSLDLRDNHLCPVSKWIHQAECSPTSFEVGKWFIVGGTRCMITRKDDKRQVFKVRYMEGRLIMQESAWLDIRRITDPKSYKAPTFDIRKSVLQARQGVDKPIFNEGEVVTFLNGTAIISQIDSKSGLMKVCQLGAVSALAKALAACSALTSADLRLNGLPARSGSDLYAAVKVSQRLTSKSALGPYMITAVCILSLSTLLLTFYTGFGVHITTTFHTTCSSPTSTSRTTPLSLS